MSRGINKVICLGFLGQDPEVRYSQSGTAMTSISVATSESWKDKTSGEQQERTEWHRVKFFGRLAEIAGEYLKKGSQVYVEGKLRTEKYTDKSGVEKYSTDIIADEMQMLGSQPESSRNEGRSNDRQAPPRSNSNNSGGNNQNRGAASNSQPNRQPAQSGGGAGGGQYGYGNNENNLIEDDIPFADCHSIW